MLIKELRKHILFVSFEDLKAFDAFAHWMSITKSLWIAKIIVATHCLHNCVYVAFLHSAEFTVYSNSESYIILQLSVKTN